MEKFFIKRKSPFDESDNQETRQEGTSSASKQKYVSLDLENLPADPGLRIKISEYHPNDRDKVRRAYLQKGPCQPDNHNFKQRKFGTKLRRFNPKWYQEYGNWLEYSIAKDAVFCLCCYLFRPETGKQSSGDAFVIGGFDAWNKKDRLDVHVGGLNSAHNEAWRKCEALMKQDQHIEVALNRHSDQVRLQYRIRLTASVDCLRFLLRQGLAFRAHDESEESKNSRNFLELLKFLADHNQIVNNVVGKNAPENLKLTAPEIQKDIINACATETTNVIIDDLGDDLFAILVDESRDISVKEQMIVILRYVDKRGCVIERFLAIVHVHDTNALSLKASIESLFVKHELSLSRLRGQGYDGASNMRGEFNGLKSLIMRENGSAYYVHCFAHQLQLTLVAIAKNDIHIASLFSVVANIVNVAGASCKRRDILRDSQVAKISEALKNGELETGRGLNQETSLKRAGDTRWGSHYSTLLNLIIMFPSVVEVLDYIVEDGLNSEQRAEACALLESMQSFDFVFSLHLMKTVLGITNELSKALQRKEQNIVNAMTLVRVSKERLQLMRDDGWDDLLEEVCSFCDKYYISIPNMDDMLQLKGRSRRKVQKVTNLHHYRVELFYAVIDMQLQEMNNRFTEVNTELLLCVASLSPDDSFSSFDKNKVIRLAQFYPQDFSPVELMALDNQLETYIVDMRSANEFSSVKGIDGLAKQLVHTKKNIVYPLVYLLVKLVLILPVATATVERAFSAMNIVKTRLRNRMGDELLNDCLVTYIEKDVFDSIDNEAILQRFQNMKYRRGQL